MAPFRLWGKEQECHGVELLFREAHQPYTLSHEISDLEAEGNAYFMVIICCSCSCMKLCSLKSNMFRKEKKEKQEQSMVLRSAVIVLMGSNRATDPRGIGAPGLPGGTP